jgi:hypothetical protein
MSRGLTSPGLLLSEDVARAFQSRRYRLVTETIGAIGMVFSEPIALVGFRPRPLDFGNDMFRNHQLAFLIPPTVNELPKRSK